jgi:hypothetical protein
MVAVIKQIPDVWEGVASERAAAHADELRRELDAAYVAVLDTGQAVGS